MKVFPPSPFAKGYKTHLKISVPKVPFETAITKYQWFLPATQTHPSFLPEGHTGRVYGLPPPKLPILDFYMQVSCSIQVVSALSGPLGAQPREQTSPFLFPLF